MAKEREELTAKRIAGLKLPKTRTIVWDAPVPGQVGVLGLRVMPTGSATFVLLARFPMRKVGGAWLLNEDKRSTAREIAPLTGFRIGTDRLTLATTRELRTQIANARDRADEWRKLIAASRDPSHEAELKAQAHAEELEAARKAKAGEKTVDDGIVAYVADVRRRKLRSADQVEQLLRRELLGQRQGDEPGTWVSGKASRWRGRTVASITPEDARSLITTVLAAGNEESRGRRRRKRGGEWAGRHTLALSKSLFGWLSEPGQKFGIQHSPFERLKAKKLIGKAKPRKRVLTDEEIRLVWRAADREGYPYGDLIKGLLWLGQRLTETSEARWSEFDLDRGLWTLAPERMKMDRGHVVPLAPMVVEWLKTLPRFKHQKGFVFTTTEGALPFSGFSRAFKRLCKVIEELRREDAQGGEVEPMPGFVLHDLRRTARTRFSKIPSEDIVKELAIAHVKPGLHEVYDQHRYIDELTDLFTRWAAMLRDVVEPPPKNVVPFEAAKAGS